MIRENIADIALRELKKYDISKTISEKYGKPIFFVISGSDSFGFPSNDSDIDIKGVYISPTKNFLGIRQAPREPPFTYMSKDRRLDVSIEEMGQYIHLINSSNGDRLEWPNITSVLLRTPEFNSLKDLVSSRGISKSLLNHYLNFARDLWSGKTGQEGVKKCLYTLRVYMTGITLFEKGNVERNLLKLNLDFKEDLVPLLIKIKESGEHADFPKSYKEKLEYLVQKLDKRLILAAKSSQFPDNPDTESLNDYLVNLRTSELK